MAYSPANSAPSSLASINVIYNERKAVENLKATTPFLGMTKMKPLPVNSGTQIKFYSYALLGANTTAVTEGTVGSPVTESQTSTTATIGQYADQPLAA